MQDCCSHTLEESSLEVPALALTADLTTLSCWLDMTLTKTTGLSRTLGEQVIIHLFISYVVIVDETLHNHSVSCLKCVIFLIVDVSDVVIVDVEVLTLTDVYFY
jgi:hypothetical protein